MLFSPSINPNTSTNASKLNSDNVGRNGGRQSSSVRWFNCDLSRSLKRKDLRAISVDGAIIDPRVAAGAEFNGLYKGILRSRRRVSHWISERGGRTYGTRISDTVRGWHVRTKIKRRACPRWGVCVRPEVHVVDLRQLADLNEAAGQILLRKVRGVVDYVSILLTDDQHYNSPAANRGWIG